jgi:hypothetical protein
MKLFVFLLSFSLVKSFFCFSISFPVNQWNTTQFWKVCSLSDSSCCSNKKLCPSLSNPNEKFLRFEDSSSSSWITDSLFFSEKISFPQNGLYIANAMVGCSGKSFSSTDIAGLDFFSDASQKGSEMIKFPDCYLSQKNLMFSSSFPVYVKYSDGKYFVRILAKVRYPKSHPVFFVSNISLSFFKEEQEVSRKEFVQVPAHNLDDEQHRPN